MIWLSFLCKRARDFWITQVEFNAHTAHWHIRVEKQQQTRRQQQ